MTMVDIVPLSEKPEAADICAAWSFGQWGCYLPGATLDGWKETYRQRARLKNRLPFFAVACVQGHVAGMISLKECDNDARKDLTPWVGSLYVHPFFRGRKIMEKLSAYIEGVAKNTFGFSVLYGFTGRSTAAYEKMGWEIIDRLPDPMGFHPDGEPLMRKTL